MRRELKRNRSIVALTLDITSYYHSIDPSFLISREFLDCAGLADSLDDWGKAFTSEFIDAIGGWAGKARRKFGFPLATSPDGVPIGLSMARIVANVLLLEFDRQVEKNLAPLYYGRYVDDIFLVLADPGDVDNVRELFRFISRRCESFKFNPRSRKGDAALALSYHAPQFTLKDEKQKLFVLDGEGGIDLLDHIESQIRAVSSERRLMPSPDELEFSASAKVLSAAGNPADDVDTLRRADTLSVRRLGWAVLLGKVETLANDLRPDDWYRQRRLFYQFAKNHVIRPDRILEQIDYLPRLLSLAVALEDWDDAYSIARRATRAIQMLRDAEEITSVRVNGGACRHAVPIWKSFLNNVVGCLQEAVLRAWPAPDNDLTGPLGKYAVRRLMRLSDLSERDLAKVVFLRDSDLARKPTRYLNRSRRRKTGEARLERTYRYWTELSAFLRTAGTTGSALPFLFPTRPYSAAEIALLQPESCVFGESAEIWAKYVRAVRGVWARSAPSHLSAPGGPRPTVDLGGPESPILLGITSLETTQRSWDHAASGQPNLSVARYCQLRDLINQAISAKPKPTHLLLPELSLPVAWLPTIARLLRNEEINLVAGLEYQHVPQSTKVRSEAVLVLADYRLGYRTWTEIRQPKARPAPREQADLRDQHGKSWDRPKPPRKPIYIQGELAFGVLVCSELQNLSYRQLFQGQLDSLMVLSWNQDLDTFSALIESTSLDVHAYIAFVNNRHFGDSRVRIPAKERYNRDLCRLRGGQNDHIVVVRVDVEALRKFQSRAARVSKPGDIFKPVPEGFRIASFRKVVPGD